MADFDNNGFSDLFITGISRQWLFRNNGKGGFEDVTAEASLDKLTSVCLGSAFVDLDQDGDLDLIVAQFAANANEAVRILRDPNIKCSQGGLAVFLNVGRMPLEEQNERGERPPSQPKFRRLEGPTDLLGPAVPTVGLAVSDLDGDSDLDLLVLVDGIAAVQVLNDRMLRFHREPLPKALAYPGRWNGAMVLNANDNGRSSLLLIGPGRQPTLMLPRLRYEGQKVRQGFEAGVIDSPPLIQAQAVDLDNDGRIDVVGLSDKGQLVMLQNNDQGLIHRQEAIGEDWPTDLQAVGVGRFGGTQNQDLMIWSRTTGLHLYLNPGNGNSAVILEMVGHRVLPFERTRCNADGFGVLAFAQVGGFWTGVEYTTQSAGLGQSRRPLVLGLGQQERADVIRFRWPDGCIQAEIDFPAGVLFWFDELNRDVHW